MSYSVNKSAVTIGKVALQDHLPEDVWVVYKDVEAVEVRGCNDPDWLAFELAKSGAFVVATDRLRDDVIVCTLQKVEMSARS